MPSQFLQTVTIDLLAALQQLFSSRKLFVLFEEELKCNPLTDHQEPKDVFPIFKQSLEKLMQKLDVKLQTYFIHLQHQYDYGNTNMESIEVYYALQRIQEMCDKQTELNSMQKFRLSYDQEFREVILELRKEILRLRDQMQAKSLIPVYLADGMPEFKQDPAKKSAEDTDDKQTKQEKQLQKQILNIIPTNVAQTQTVTQKEKPQINALVQTDLSFAFFELNEEQSNELFRLNDQIIAFKQTQTQLKQIINEYEQSISKSDLGQENMKLQKQLRLLDRQKRDLEEKINVYREENQELNQIRDQMQENANVAELFKQKPISIETSDQIEENKQQEYAKQNLQLHSPSVLMNIKKSIQENAKEQKSQNKEITTKIKNTINVQNNKEIKQLGQLDKQQIQQQLNNNNKLNKQKNVVINKQQENHIQSDNIQSKQNSNLLNQVNNRQRRNSINTNEEEYNNLIQNNDNINNVANHNNYDIHLNQLQIDNNQQQIVQDIKEELAEQFIKQQLQQQQQIDIQKIRIREVGVQTGGEVDILDFSPLSNWVQEKYISKQINDQFDSSQRSQSENQNDIHNVGRSNSNDKQDSDNQNTKRPQQTQPSNAEQNQNLPPINNEQRTSFSGYNLQNVSNISNDIKIGNNSDLTYSQIDDFQLSPPQNLLKQSKTKVQNTTETRYNKPVLRAAPLPGYNQKYPEYVTVSDLEPNLKHNIHLVPTVLQPLDSAPAVVSNFNSRASVHFQRIQQQLADIEEARKRRRELQLQRHSEFVQKQQSALLNSGQSQKPQHYPILENISRHFNFGPKINPQKIQEKQNLFFVDKSTHKLKTSPQRINASAYIKTKTMTEFKPAMQQFRPQSQVYTNNKLGNREKRNKIVQESVLVVGQQIKEFQ
ncbi:Conserved_hypothetical protein [Hexamita inflata]|uniref:Uncharacterized protein n=1 Tax=Hexamita inflata TaxID=28002 RepID=A0AA86Q3E3_9EUKA|nr:Conserved hypothetical protein [Hexamita inflata]